MNSSKIFQFLQLLSPKEVRRFKEFVSSPYFNKKPDLVPLLDLLTTHLNRKLHVPSETEYWNLLYPDTPPNLNRLRKLKSGLMELMVNFLTHQGVTQQGNGLAERIFLAELNRLGATKQFLTYYRDTNRKLNQVKIPSETQLENQYHIELEHSRMIQISESKTRSTQLNRLMDILERSHLLQKLRFACLLLNEQKVITQTSTPSHFDPQLIYTAVKDHPSELPLLPRLYYLQLSCLLFPETQTDYTQLKSALLANWEALPDLDRIDLQTMIMNHCSRQFNLGIKAYGEQLFEWYEWIHEKEMEGKDNQLVPILAKNIITLAARLGKFEWAQQFLKEQGPNLNPATPTERKAYLEYFSGILAFHSGEIDSAAKKIYTSLPSLPNIFFALNARTLLLRCYYEQGNEIGMDSLCTSFRLFIRRNKLISSIHKVHFKSFILLLKRLIAVPPGDRVRLQKLQSDLHNHKNIACRNWLNTKIEAQLLLSGSSGA